MKTALGNQYRKQQPELVSQRTVHRIGYGVVIGHVAALILPLAIMTVVGWIMPPEERITVMLYDPTLDNVVDNPSPDPSPDNPVPPSGTPDAQTEPEITPEPEVTPEPPPPEIESKLPPVLQPPKVKPLAQPIVKPKVKPLPQPKVKDKVKPEKKTDQKPDKTTTKPDSRQSGSKTSSQGSKSSQQRGSNSEAGHNAPGGERGNSGYDIQVAMMIKQMWITPDQSRLGGRDPRVLIQLMIAPDGRVLRAQILAKSGVLAMDESVAALLSNLRFVKKPFDGKEHTLSFYLKAMD